MPSAGDGRAIADLDVGITPSQGQGSYCRLYSAHQRLGERQEESGSAA